MNKSVRYRTPTPDYRTHLGIAKNPHFSSLLYLW
jgi:hypothetical protein